LVGDVERGVDDETLVVEHPFTELLDDVLAHLFDEVRRHTGAERRG